MPMKGLLKPWLWPSRVRAGAVAWHVRLGRLMHWISLALAAASMITGAWMTGVSAQLHRSYKLAAVVFDRRHENDGTWEVELPTGPKFRVHASRSSGNERVEKILVAHLEEHPWQQAAIADTAAKSETVDVWEDGERPEIHPIDYVPVIAGAAMAAFFAMLGRAARYLLSAE